MDVPQQAEVVNNFNLKDWTLIIGAIIGSLSLTVSTFSYRLSLKNKREAALDEKGKLIRKNLIEYKLSINELNALIANLLISEIIAEFISELKKNLGEQFVKQSDITDYIFHESNQPFIKHLSAVAVGRSKYYAKLQETISRIEKTQVEIQGVLPVISNIFISVNEILKTSAQKPFRTDTIATLLNASKKDILPAVENLNEDEVNATYRTILLELRAYQGSAINQLFQQDIDNVIYISEKLISIYCEKSDIELEEQEKKEKGLKDKLKPINMIGNTKTFHDVQKLESCLNLIKKDLFTQDEIDEITVKIYQLKESNPLKND